MKKAICIILLLSTLLTVLASCKGVTVIEDESETEAVTKETTDTETADTTAVTEPVDDGIDHRFDWQYEYKVEHENASIEGDYIFNNAEAKNYSLILKRNVVTGECTTVCTDPFCEHNSASCPFYKTTNVVGIGNTMYGIMRDDNINKNVLYSFNVDTNKKEIVYESTATLYDLCQYKYYIFFRPTDKGLLRLDTRTGEIEKVKTQPGRMTSVSKDMIIWIQEHKGEMATFTATDLLGNDPKPYNIYIYNGKLHEGLYDEETGKMSYAQLDRNGEVEKILIENSHMALIVGDSMIYFGTYDDGKTHWRDPEKPEKGQILSNGDIYIAPLDTFEFRLLCHIEEAEPFDIARSNLNMLLSGDWVAIDTPPNYPTTEDKIGTFNDMILVNMKTGEYHISRYIE
jgi:hypothetical protein